MSKIEDGGAAFPMPASEHSQGGHFEQNGMSLRDYFAGQALHAFMPRLEIAWQAGPSAIERAKRAAMARGDWDPDSIPAFNLDTWRTEDAHERRDAIKALGDSNPPAMAEVIGYMLLAATGSTHD